LDRERADCESNHWRLRVSVDSGYNLRSKAGLLLGAENGFMSTRSVILSQLVLVAKEHSQTLAPLVDDLPLLESGLDSLGFAVVVARLEDQLGVDPFSSDDNVEFPVTLADFIGAYESLVK
jgi:acyl carrier protein